MSGRNLLWCSRFNFTCSSGPVYVFNNFVVSRAAEIQKTIASFSKVSAAEVILDELHSGSNCVRSKRAPMEGYSFCRFLSNKSPFSVENSPAFFICRQYCYFLEMDASFRTSTVREGGGLIFETTLLCNRGFGVQTMRRWILLWLHWYPPLSTEIMGFADTSLSPDVW